MTLLAHPFHIGPQGVAATVEDGSDQHTEQQLRVIISTRLGERPMAYLFGVPDPTWGGLDVSDVQACLSLYGPEDVAVSDITMTPIDDQRANATLSYSRSGDGGL